MTCRNWTFGPCFAWVAGTDVGKTPINRVIGLSVGLQVLCIRLFTLDDDPALKPRSCSGSLGARKIKVCGFKHWSQPKPCCCRMKPSANCTAGPAALNLLMRWTRAKPLTSEGFHCHYLACHLILVMYTSPTTHTGSDTNTHNLTNPPHCCAEGGLGPYPVFWYLVLLCYAL